MDRISTATAVPDLFGVGKPGFRDGNKALGILPTDLNALLFNSIQEELMNVIEGAGLSADDADFTQLRQAITAMIIAGQKSIIIHDAVFEASVADEDVVYWHAGNSEFTKAVADGSAAQNAVGFADVTNEKVYAFGSAPIFTGLTPGAYYLDATTPGAITAVAPAANIVKLGLAVSATEIYVDIDSAGNSGDASETVKGVIEIANAAENAAGTDNTRASTPAGIRAALNATGSAPIYAARAYVRFNGAGVISIEGSGNVSSITDNATGSYTVNFTTALPDANYSYALSAKAVNSFGLNDVVILQHTSVAPTASSCALMCKGASGGGANDTVISATFFR